MRLTGDRCQCPSCGQYFNSTGAFDRHRVGDYTARRCLTVADMVAAGMRRNDAGFWIRRPMLATSRKALRGPEGASPEGINGPIAPGEGVGAGGRRMPLNGPTNRPS